MQPQGMHGKKDDWRAARDQEIDRFVGEASAAGHAEPSPDLWDLEDEPSAPAVH